MALRPGRSRLPEHLNRIGMSQSEFARRIESSAPMVSRYISGEKIMSVVKMKMGADVLGVYMDELYEWEYIPR